tara:strand:+ start:1476 stop:1865 length:390 start_codon:yes stop_codon:yes gene_type:complete
MFDDLNDNNIDLYMMRMYENTQCVDIDEYYDDLKRIKYIKRLFNRYLAGDELKERLILNHIIILYNVFDRSAATRILFTKMESKFHPLLKTFLLFLQFMPEMVMGIRGYDIPSVNIPVDLNIANKLRKI